MADENQTPGPKAGQDPTKKKKGLGGLGKAQKKKEISKLLKTLLKTLKRQREKTLETYLNLL